MRNFTDPKTIEDVEARYGVVQNAVRAIGDAVQNLLPIFQELIDQNTILRARLGEGEHEPVALQVCRCVRDWYAGGRSDRGQNEHWDALLDPMDAVIAKLERGEELTDDDVRSLREWPITMMYSSKVRPNAITRTFEEWVWSLRLRDEAEEMERSLDRRLLSHWIPRDPLDDGCGTRLAWLTYDPEMDRYFRGGEPDRVAFEPKDFDPCDDRTMVYRPLPEMVPMPRDHALWMQGGMVWIVDDRKHDDGRFVTAVKV